ncbi:MAG: DsbA family protein [Rhizobiaceae bacterium]
MTDGINVYYSFRSPYSYLASADIVALEKDYTIPVHLRVVLPIAVRSSEFFRPQNEQWVRYIQLDWHRRAEFLGLPHVWPEPDPVVQDMTTLEISKDQPYIFRLSKLGVEAERQGHGPAFAFHVSRLIFGGTKNWNDPEKLSAAVARAGLDLAVLDAAIDCGDHLDEIEANQENLRKAGHWGVPTFEFRGEPFFGQDRVELLRWRLSKEGIDKQ